MKQVLDNDLDPFEHRELVVELRQVAATATDPNERMLGEALLAYVTSRGIRLSLTPNRIERLLVDLRRVLAVGRRGSSCGRSSSLRSACWG